MAGVSLRASAAEARQAAVSRRADPPRVVTSSTQAAFDVRFFPSTVHYIVTHAATYLAGAPDVEPVLMFLLERTTAGNGKGTEVVGTSCKSNSLPTVPIKKCHLFFASSFSLFYSHTLSLLFSLCLSLHISATL